MRITKHTFRPSGKESQCTAGSSLNSIKLTFSTHYQFAAAVPTHACRATAAAAAAAGCDEETVV